MEQPQGRAIITGDDGFLMVQIEGDLDYGSAPAIKDAIWGSLGKSVRVLLDAGKLNYVSSAGLRVLLSLGQYIASLDGALVLANLKPEIDELLGIVGFKDYFKISPTLQEGIERIRQS